MSAVDHFSDQQFGWHTTPYHIRVGDLVKPAGPGPGNFEESDGQYTHAAHDEGHAAIFYGSQLHSMGHRAIHTYAVEPTGAIENDPHDTEAVRSKSPMRVIAQSRSFRQVYSPPVRDNGLSGHADWEAGS